MAPIAKIVHVFFGYLCSLGLCVVLELCRIHSGVPPSHCHILKAILSLLFLFPSFLSSCFLFSRVFARHGTVLPARTQGRVCFWVGVKPPTTDPLFGLALPLAAMCCHRCPSRPPSSLAQPSIALCRPPLPLSFLFPSYSFSPFYFRFYTIRMDCM